MHLHFACHIFYLGFEGYILALIAGRKPVFLHRTKYIKRRPLIDNTSLFNRSVVKYKAKR